MTYVPERIRSNVDRLLLHPQSQPHVLQRTKGIWSESGRQTEVKVSASRARRYYCRWRRENDFEKRRRKGYRRKGIRIVSTEGVEEQSSWGWQGPCQALLLWRASTVDRFSQAMLSSCGDPWSTRADPIIARWEEVVEFAGRQITAGGLRKAKERRPALSR